MKRFLLPVAAAVLVAACQDSTDSVHRPVRRAARSAGRSRLRGDHRDARVHDVRHLWAVVAANGSLTRGSRVTGVTRLGIGRYEVTFNRSVTGCAYVATTQNAYSQALGIFTASGHLSANGVYVETKNQGGGLTDGPFDLLVSCGPLGTRFAVVGYSADLVRATSGTSADLPRRGPLPGALRQRRARLRLPGHRGRPGQRAGLQSFRGVHRGRGRTRTPSTSRPRTRAAACRTACPSIWP